MAELAVDGPAPGELFLWLEVPALTHARVLVGVGSEASLEEATERLTVLEERDGTTRSEAGVAVAAATPTAQAARPSAAGVRRPLEDLPNRELDILELLAQRLQNKEIADRLSISPQTVNYHLKHVYQKLEVGGRRQAVASAVEKGILSRATGRNLP